MILTDYYSFKHLDGAKSNTRLDCTASTRSHGAFELTRAKDGRLWVYVCDNTYTKAGRECKADLAMNGRNGFLSSIYVPDMGKPAIGYGDLRHTADALLFVVDGSYQDSHYIEGIVIEVFVARGMRANVKSLYSLLSDEDEALLNEMKQLRESALAEQQQKGGGV